MLYAETLIDNCSFINNTFHNEDYDFGWSPVPAAIICRYNSVVEISDTTTFENNICLDTGAVADITIQERGILNDLTFDFCSLNVSSYSANLSVSVNHPSGAKIFSSGRDGARISLYLRDLVGEVYSLGDQFIIYDNGVVTRNGLNVSYDAFVNGRYTFYGDFESAGEGSVFNEGTIIVTREMVPYVDLYVSSVRGSDDSGDGSFENPFYTLRKALNYAYEHTDNITIHLLEGNYLGSDNLGLSLSSFMNITIIGEGVDKTIIGGEDFSTYFHVTRGNKVVTIENLSFINTYNTTGSRVIVMEQESSLVLNNILFCVNASALPPSSEEFVGISNAGGDLFANNITLVNSSLSSLFYIRTSNNINVEIINSNFYNSSLGRYVIYTDSPVLLTVDNCNFANIDGGAISTRAGSVPDSTKHILSNSNFTNIGYPKSISGGGINGITLMTHCNLFNSTGDVENTEYIEYCNFTCNKKGAVQSAYTTIDHCIFIGNTNDMGGAVTNHGNAMQIKNSVFINNTATYEGGAIGFSHPGWGSYVNYGVISNSTFINNSANNGGAFGLNFGVAVGGGFITVVDCDFINNYAETSGGAINIPRISLNITDSNFINNSADSSGGAIYGGVDCFSVNFINNTASFMGGALNGGGTLFNCVLENNTAPYMGGTIYATSRLNLTYSAIVGGESLIGPAIFFSGSNDKGDLSYNWWGSNDDPNLLVYNSPGIYKWAVLEVTPDEITVGDNVTVNLVFKDNEGYTLNGYIPVRVATMDAIDVNLSDDSILISQNSGSFTAVSEDSLGSVLITVDNQTILLGVKHDSQIIGNDLTVDYGDYIAYNVTVLSNSVPIADATVNLIVNEKLYTNVSDENGVVNFIIDTLAAGNYSMVYEFIGNDQYWNSSNTSLLTVNKADSDLTFDLDGLVYGDDLVVTANVGDNASGKVIISIDNNSKSVDVVNGSAVAVFSNLPVGEHIVYAVYTGDDNYNSGIFNQSFNITKYPSTLNITVGNIDYGSDLVVIAFVDVDATGNVTFTIGGASKTANIAYGSAQVVFSKLKAGNYTVYARYNGDNDFAPSANNATFEVYSADSNHVTNDTFFNFFDDKGNLLDSYTMDNLTFVGEFGGLGVDKIVINRPISLLSDDAVLNNIAVDIESDNVSLDGFTLNIDDSEYGVLINGNHSVITNNDINFECGNDTDSYGVFADGISDLVFTDNSISFVGNTNGSTANAAVKIVDADKVLFKNNDIDANLSSVPVSYDEYWNSVIMSQAVDLSGNNMDISDNSLVSDYNTAEGSYDSVYGFNIAGDNISFESNDVDVNGHGYAYGVDLTGNNITANKNDISVSSDGDYAAGLVLNGPFNGDVTGNNLDVTSNNATYGIYSSGWTGDVNADYTDNTVEVDSHIAYGLELMGNNETVSGNKIVADGNYTMGIVSSSNDLLVKNNSISSNGKGEGSPETGDSFGAQNTGIVIATSGNANITGNNINSTGDYTVNIIGSNSTVVDGNELRAAKNTGNPTVAGDGTIINNVPEMTGVVIRADNLTKYFGNNKSLEFTLEDEAGNALSNKKLTVNLNGKNYTRTTNASGVAVMKINLPAGEYNVTTTFNGEGKLASVSTTVPVNILSTIIADDIVKYYKNGTQYIATFVDSNGNILPNINVTFNINGVKYTRKTNENGSARMNINLVPETYIVSAYNSVTNETNSNTIEVLSLITENNDLTKYFGNSSPYIVKVVDGQGNPVAGEKVSFNINGVVYTRSTNASGHAKLNINLPDGDYVITATYNGMSVSNNIKVLPILKAEDLTKKFGGSEKFNVTVLDGQGNPVGAGEKVTFNINGLFYTRTTDSDGIAHLNIRLPSGKYIITSSYGNAVTSNTVTVVD